MTAAWPTKKMSWRAPAKCGATAASQRTLPTSQRWPRPAPSTATLPRCESRRKLTSVVVGKKKHLFVLGLCLNCCLTQGVCPPLCALTVIKGPRSFDSCPLWKKSTIKSSTDPMAKECQWICGLPYKVSSNHGLLCLFLHFTRAARFNFWRHRHSVFLSLEFKTLGFFLTAFLS